MLRSIEEMNNNPLSMRRKKRYQALSEDIKKKLEELDKQDPREYQLKVIKRKRIIPQKGRHLFSQPPGIPCISTGWLWKEG